MNRFFSVLTAVLLVLSPAMAEQPISEQGPQELEPVVDPDSAADGLGEGDLDWVENFVDPEGNAPQVDEEELRRMIPALLSIERKVQHQTACQYWLKLENRLPFKIRNLAMRFSAYIMGKGYDRPILFDTEIKSFSELRPTDSQFRDIFFEYAKCEDLDFIKVEDAGRCSVGELTRFSSQSGDCARFIEMAESEDICIYLDTSMLKTAGESAQGNRNQPPDNPCGLILQADIDILLEQFEVSYEAGDLENFVALFDEDATVNDGAGLAQIRRDYGELFRNTKQREIEFRNRAWKPKRSGSAIIRFDIALRIDNASYWGPSEYTVDGRMTLIKRKGGIFISSFLHSQKKDSSLPSIF